MGNVKRRGIFSRLIISFLIFTVLILVIIMGCFFTVALGLGQGEGPGVNVYEIFDKSGKVSNTTSISRLGGWIEKLDENYQVIETWGEKQTAQQGYTKQQFSEILAWDQGTTLDYIGYLNYREEEGEDFYYLTILPRNVVQTEFTIVLNDLPIWNIVFVGLFLLLFIFLCVGMSYYLSSTIKKPLKQLSDGMERVYSGEEGVRLVFDAKAEFAQIKDTFNVMMDRLEKEKAEKLLNERKKNQLLLDLSHDIRTPVSTIKSYANALEANLVKEEEKQKVYQTIDAKANRVSGLMEDMFMMLKLDSPEYVLTKKETDLNELLREICVEYYEEIEEKGYEFNIQIPEEKIIVSLDEKLFSRVITNLLSNAIKYNQTGHFIGISLGREKMENQQEVLRITVSDDGDAILEEYRGQLFDAFVRGEQARTSTGGTGLGLSIAKTIVLRHNGSLTYQRREEKNCFDIFL